ncbi:MAG: ATP-binding protein, partial [Gemmatimonadetes bacterium]|nr:ATP-binding protein [Gemmatimonadota bacterium]
IVLEDHLADTVALMTTKASLKGVSLELSAAPEVPTVTGSVVDLNQVWMHLVDNAIDAATASVRIFVERHPHDDRVVVRVVDDGAGIPASDHERIFEPFFTTKDVGQGRGLGLDVVQTVVRGHRGTVDLASTPGRTEFRVTLPAAGTST